MNAFEVSGEGFGADALLTSIIARHGAATPDTVAAIQGDRRVTWSALAQTMDRIAAALLRDFKHGDRIAILSSSSIAYVELFFGALRAGLCVVPLPTMVSHDALALMYADSGAKLLFASESLRDLALAVAPHDAVRTLPFTTESPQEPDAFVPPVVAGLDAFDIMYSSGTTGVPKGIVHSHVARKASYAGSRARYFSSRSVNVIATPFYSNTTCVTWLLTTAAGGVNVILEKFSPDALLDVIEHHRVTHAMLVPVQYERLLAAPRFQETDLSSLQVLFSTSAPLRAETKRALLERTQAQVIEIYGLTEGGPVTVLDARAHQDKLQSVGTPAPGVDIRIVDDAGIELPRGATGEIIGRSSNLMGGYWNRTNDTAAAILRIKGVPYFRTGDLGRFDDDGFLYLLDRKKDVIISGGFNVYATDLEAVLLRHPAVLEATVIGVPSEAWGETPIAFVVLRQHPVASAEEIRAFANESLGKVQRIADVRLREELPKNAIGKILKRALRESYLAPARTQP